MAQQRVAEAPHTANTNPTHVLTADDLFKLVQRCVRIQELLLFYLNKDTISGPQYDKIVSYQKDYAGIEVEIMAHIDKYTDLESRFAKVSAELVDAIWELDVTKKFDSGYQKYVEIHYPSQQIPSDSDFEKHKSVFLLYNRLKYWLGQQASHKSAQAHAAPGGSTLHTGTSKL
ncbi:hypothetical protein BD410DRAFT_832229 [Rickenella mellea]|uniref:Uncharacterized protein n=1 Tax=Rickenella mellea TaxID=50990 RepID=A0A4Y7PM01_9AGAM|nr:hypothetical protein BD410DRAFT_832229 [Rickenella mellea]